jgi:hypothetical protein
LRWAKGNSFVSTTIARTADRAGPSLKRSANLKPDGIKVVRRTSQNRGRHVDGGKVLIAVFNVSRVRRKMSDAGNYSDYPTAKSAPSVTCSMLRMSDTDTALSGLIFVWRRLWCARKSI